ncbi:hypothetical protein [Pseudoroseicyclus aestuarii]|uniref:Excalibur calcium-binding domain-containing protein n=1 Tax=Pseudoroseicyclus aestuarii TaxID=1795041 RepID=A0A318T123_9RHOB|nr:hypothetical protein [Pseudoroseicyclus aestuarii]PYE85687.1 hypothetical protein DFP88_101356 [Pseudoroseicyclus aestuarii]
MVSGLKSGAVLSALAALSLSACAPAVPDSAVAARNAQLAGASATSFGGSTLPPPGQAPATSFSPAAPTAVTPLSDTAAAPAVPGGISTSELAAAGIGGGAAPAAAPPEPATYNAAAPGGDADRRGGVQASPGNAAPDLVGVVPGALSDEQNFDAVAGRESIESDAERRARQAAEYQVVTPTALPQRDGGSGPNLVQYALNAPNARGQEYYSRFMLGNVPGRYERNCARYGNADDAQRVFMARGGPDRDPLNIDPDGDGFACGWDPAPFRAALGD